MTCNSQNTRKFNTNFPAPNELKSHFKYISYAPYTQTAFSGCDVVFKMFEKIYYPLLSAKLKCTCCRGEENGYVEQLVFTYELPTYKMIIIIIIIIRYIYKTKMDKDVNRNSNMC